jgi:hypothetical protein
VKLGWLEKIAREAFQVGRRPALEIQVGGKHYVIISREAFLEYDRMLNDYD